MKVLLFVLLAFSLPAIAQSSKTVAYREAESYIKEKDYFRARQYYRQHAKQMVPAEKLVMEAYFGNVFNRPASSNTAIAAFFRGHSKTATDSLKLELLRLKQMNHVRLFEYADALASSNAILNQYKTGLSDKDREDYENTAIFWKALKDSPKQEVIKAGNSAIQMTRDIAKLANLEVKANGTAANFIFDTGANFSTVTESTAKAFGMKLLEGVIEVGAITGGKVNSSIAICPQFSLGNATIKNAVFLVMPDAALAFPQIGFQINGIIGFPVIEALGEVQLTRDDRFIIPKAAATSGPENMALEFLTPVIDINGEYFTFDTGATATILYSKYLKKHEAEVAAANTITDLQFGGAGGVVTKKGYKITYSPEINNKVLNLKDVQVFRESISESKDHFYGNIGQDVIKQFNKMTINFTVMSIMFE